MDDGPAARPARALRPLAVSMVVIVVVGFLVRPPSTSTADVDPTPTADVDPTPTADVDPTPTAGADATPTAEVDASQPTPASVGLPSATPSLEGRAPVWAQIPGALGGATTALTRLDGPVVWTGQDLLVGFQPDVVVFTPTLPDRRAFRRAAAQPLTPTAVHGATQAYGADVFVFGHRVCPTCEWLPSLHALDPNTDVWRRLPDAPEALGDDTDVDVVTADSRVVIVRSSGGSAAERGVVQVQAFDPLGNAWADLAFPSDVVLSRVQAVGMGSDLLVLGTGEGADGTSTPGATTAHALRWRASTADWDDVGEGLPIEHPGSTTAVWTGDEVIVLGQALGARGLPPPGPVTARLDLATGTWSPLPPVPATAIRDVTPADVASARHPVRGVFDGTSAVFVSNRLHLAWDVDARRWISRSLPPAAEDASLVWARDRLLRLGVEEGRPTIRRFTRGVDVDAGTDPPRFTSRGGR